MTAPDGCLQRTLTTEETMWYSREWRRPKGTGKKAPGAGGGGMQWLL